MDAKFVIFFLIVKGVYSLPMNFTELGKVFCLLVLFAEAFFCNVSKDTHNSSSSYF